MKTARDNIFTSRDALRRLMAEYGSFDTASRLCADYCITANEIALLIDAAPKLRRLKSRLKSLARSEKPVDVRSAYLIAR